MNLAAHDQRLSRTTLHGNVSAPPGERAKWACAVKYGLEKLNADVAAWMRGDSACDGSHAAPPYLAMGDASSVMWNRQVLCRAPCTSRRRWCCSTLL